MRGAKLLSTERGALTGNRRLRRVWRGNVALIGDASGTVDAITGEGLGLSFNQAMVLAECLEARDLRRYQTEHRRLSVRPRAMARLMLTLDGRPRLQHRTLQVFQQASGHFSTIGCATRWSSASSRSCLGQPDSGMGTIDHLKMRNEAGVFKHIPRCAFVSVILVVLAGGIVPALAQDQAFQFDPAQTTVKFTLGDVFTPCMEISN